MCVLSVISIVFVNHYQQCAIDQNPLENWLNLSSQCIQLTISQYWILKMWMNDADELFLKGSKSTTNVDYFLNKIEIEYSFDDN